MPCCVYLSLCLSLSVSFSFTHSFTPPILFFLFFLKVRSIKVTLHGKSLGIPEMAGPMSAAVIKGALNLLLAQEVSY